MTLSDKCAKALISDVACDPNVLDFKPGYYYPPEILQRACTDTCKSALDSYLDRVKSSCGTETIVGPFDLEASALIVPGMRKDLFQKTCLQDNGRYCNNVAATAAVIADPGGAVSRFNYLSSVPPGTVPPDPCDMCFIKSLQLKAGSPYFDGPDLASMSVYMSMTSQCGSTLTSQVRHHRQQRLLHAWERNTQIQPGDDCYSISRKKKIGTAWLLSDNHLASYCADFPKSGELCISNTCDTYTVKQKDTCSSIAKGANITVPQLRAWNPIINAGCYNMHRLNGTELCISAPGQKFVPGDATDLPGATVTTPAPVPSDAALGSNHYCGRWYGVKKGDYCNLIVLKFGITMDNFIFLNPALNSNCTNLYAEESYCVLPVGDINTYSGKPGYVSTPTGSEPTTTGIRNCQIPPQVYRVDPESFESWNAGLGNISRPECSFKPGFRYCGRYYALSDDSDEEEPTPTTSTTTSDDPTSTSATPTTPMTSSKPSPGAPTMTGQPSACNKWHTVTNGESCTVIPKKFGITLEQFLAWNPTVKSDCTENFWAGYAYCVGVKTSPS
ncbi:hypothetical protein H101_01329 [Trichophyton interdigitale H6]|nr:hypothetical protein H101_01329 [Trichophyton interdigitale H6]